MADKEDPVFDEDGGGSGTEPSGPTDSGEPSDGDSSGPADGENDPAGDPTDEPQPGEEVVFSDDEGEVVVAPAATQDVPEQSETIEFPDDEGEVIIAVPVDGQPVEVPTEPYDPSHDGTLPPLDTTPLDPGDTIGPATPEDVEDARKKAFEEWEEAHQHHHPHGAHTEEDDYDTESPVDPDPFEQEPLP